jgi:tRNA (guanine37-N1)-methyltransferase
MTFQAAVLTLYPEMFPGPLGVSLAGRALGEGKWSLDAVQIRDFANDKHRTVDDTPAGGGAGMVLKVDVLARAIDHAREMMAQTLRQACSLTPPHCMGRTFPILPMQWGGGPPTKSVVVVEGRSPSSP